MGEAEKSDGSNVVFEHKSFIDRLKEYDGEIEVYEFDWGEPVGREMVWIAGFNRVPPKTETIKMIFRAENSIISIKEKVIYWGMEYGENKNMIKVKLEDISNKNAFIYEIGDDYYILGQNIMKKISYNSIDAQIYRFTESIRMY